MDKENVIARIKRFRLERGLTQAELAEKCNVSKSLISKVEAKKVSIHLDLLVDIAKALNVTLAELLEETPTRKNTTVVRAIERQKWVSGVFGKSGFEYYRLAGLHGANMDAFFLVIRKQTLKSPKMVVHEGHEFLYVLEGKVQLKFRDEEYILREGDTAFFDANLEHTILPYASEMVQLILVYSYN